MKSIRFGSLIVLLTLVAPLEARAWTPEPGLLESRRLMRFVERAAALVEETGEEAFEKFRRKGSSWFRGERYVFVLQPDGVTACNPAQPSREGKNALLEGDAESIAVVKMLLDLVSGERTAAWASYLWPMPGSKTPAAKTTYVIRARAPDGKQYIVGSGVYGLNPPRAHVQQLVDDAAGLLQTKGRGALPELRDPKGRFAFQDSYVFVLDDRGVMLSHPALPELEGTRQWSLKDVSGRPFVREFIRTALENGSGWVDYLWPRPGQEQPVKKSSYIRGVELGGRTIVVGAGLYL